MARNVRAIWPGPPEQFKVHCLAVIRAIRQVKERVECMNDRLTLVLHVETKDEA